MGTKFEGHEAMQRLLIKISILAGIVLIVALVISLLPISWKQAITSYVDWVALNKYVKDSAVISFVAFVLSILANSAKIIEFVQNLWKKPIPTAVTSSTSYREGPVQVVNRSTVAGDVISGKQETGTKIIADRVDRVIVEEQPSMTTNEVEEVDLFALRPPLELQDDAEWLRLIHRLAWLAQQDQNHQALFSLVNRVQDDLKSSASPEGKGFYKTKCWAQFKQSLDALNSFRALYSAEVKCTEVVVEKLVERLNRAADRYYAREEWYECIELCDAVIKLSPQHRAAARNRQEAVSQVARLDQLKASRYEAANADIGAGCYEEAISLLEWIYKVDPNYRNVAFLLKELRRRCDV